MFRFQDKLDRVVAWIERENARSDEVLLRQPRGWHVAKILVGLACIARSVPMALDATGAGGYMLATFFLMGGVALVYDGAVMLRGRATRSS